MTIKEEGGDEHDEDDDDEEVSLSISLSLLDDPPSVRPSDRPEFLFGGPPGHPCQDDQTRHYHYYQYTLMVSNRVRIESVSQTT